MAGVGAGARAGEGEVVVAVAGKSGWASGEGGAWAGAGGGAGARAGAGPLSHAKEPQVVERLGGGGAGAGALEWCWARISSSCRWISISDTACFCFCFSGEGLLSTAAPQGTPEPLSGVLELLACGSMLARMASCSLRRRASSNSSAWISARDLMGTAPAAAGDVRQGAFPLLVLLTTVSPDAASIASLMLNSIRCGAGF
mmetsp:Transcript_35330/g.57148  ORF Transcript_35330/g.57148 Transcript_35330/m.57148 type:complete len:200 (-) Transcript_35330:3283-3882(-)